MGNEFRTRSVWDITERDETPVTVDEYLPNEKYHHSLKGCDCEMKVIKALSYGKEAHTTYAIEKYCKTHNITCSKTGWELGHYMRTNSLDLKDKSEDPYCIYCGKEKNSKQHSCKDCSPMAYNFTRFIAVNYSKELRLYPRIDEINIKIIEYYLLKYEKLNFPKYKKYVDLIVFNLQHKYIKEDNKKEILNINNN